MKYPDRWTIPECATCHHEHSAVWKKGRLIATGPCGCGCMVETRCPIKDHDREQVWMDDRGHIWEWSDLDGWVVDGMCTLGGFDPPDDGTVFTKAFTGESCYCKGTCPCFQNGAHDFHGKDDCLGGKR